MLFTPLDLDHVALGVRDQKAAQKFYTEVLGCTVERTNPEISLIQPQFGEQLIDLMPGAPSGNFLHHYCLSIRCDDLAGLADALRAKGVLVEEYYAMLQRNLLYTGVTRGKRLVVSVGQKKAVAIAVRNVSGCQRWAKLGERLAPKTAASAERRRLGR